MTQAELEVLLGHRERLPVDVSPIPASMSLPGSMEHGLTSVGGDLPVDGSIGARTAALEHPYDDDTDRGRLYHDDDTLAEFFHAGHNAGLQVGVHAIGDRAIEQVLRTWERVYLALDSRERRHFRARRHRIEHFVLPSADQVERAAMLGLAVSIQPAFDRRWGAGRGSVRGATGPGQGDGRAPVPDDARPWDRGRGRLGLARHAAGSDARDRRAGDAPRTFATSHAA